MRFVKKKSNKTSFVRKVEIQFINPDDKYLLDSQSKKLNFLQNKLKEEIEKDLWLLNRSGFYNLSNTTIDQLVSSIFTNQGVRNRVPKLKDKYPFLKTVYSSTAKNIGLKVADSINKFVNKKAGWIKYKSWKKSWCSLEYEEKNKGWQVDGGSLSLSFGKELKHEAEDNKNESDDSTKDTPDNTKGDNTTPTPTPTTLGKQIKFKAKLIGNPKGLNKAKAVRIVMKNHKYYAIFTLEKNIKSPHSHSKQKSKKICTKKICYLDPNIKNFAFGVEALVKTNNNSTSSSASHITLGKSFEIANLKAISALEQKIDKLKRKRDRCVKNSLYVDVVLNDGKINTYYRESRRYYKLNNVVKRLNEALREQKKHFMYSLSNKLFKEYDLVAIGDYRVKQEDSLPKAKTCKKIVRKMKNQTFHAEFKNILSWVALKSKKELMIIDETNTTRTCSCCGKVVEQGIHPEIRQWKCSKCNSLHNRDENACKNGLKKVLNNLNQITQKRDLNLKDAKSKKMPSHIPSLSVSCHAQAKGSLNNYLYDWIFHPQRWTGVRRNPGSNVNNTIDVNRIPCL